MKTNDFYTELIDILELDSDANINEETPLNLDSLKILSIIAMIDENFDMQFSAEQFKSLTNINSLIELVGKDRIKL
jgi:acyl carrier protein